MTGGFTVDDQALTALGTHLSTLRSQFESGDGVIEPLLAAISHPDLHGALSAFATDWSDERKKLDARIAQVANSATGSGKTYTKADSVMASGFKPKTD